MTVLVIEATGRNIRWTEPRDLTLTDAMQLAECAEPSQMGDMRNIAMVDGHVYCVSDFRSIARGGCPCGG